MSGKGEVMNQESNGKQPSETVKKYYRVLDVARETGRSIRQVWRDARAGTIPKPFKHGRNTYWIPAEIHAFMKGLEQKRSN